MELDGLKRALRSVLIGLRFCDVGRRLAKLNAIIDQRQMVEECQAPSTTQTRRTDRRTPAIEFGAF